MSIKSTEKNKKLIQAGALGFSLFFHIGLLLLIGGAVLIEGIIPKPTFTEYMPMGETVDEVTTTPEEEQPQENTEPLNSNEPVMEQTVAPMPDATGAPDVILMDSTSAAPTFIMPAANPNATGINTAGIGGSDGGSGGASVNSATKAAIRGMTNFFGTKGEESGLVGTFYDPSRNSKGDSFSGDVWGLVRRYAQSGSKAQKTFDGLWKSKATLSSSFIAIPPTFTQAAFEAFGGKPQGNISPPFFVHYSAKIAAPEPGSYRFVGFADNFLIVSINGKIVLMGDNHSSTDTKSYSTTKTTKEMIGWESSEPLLYVVPPFAGYNVRCTFGDYIKWDENEFKRIDILIGDGGGTFQSALFIQKEGVDYAKPKKGEIPILPLFRISDEKDKLGAMQKFNLEEARGSKQLIFKTE